jgi:hypothetical protein
MLLCLGLTAAVVTQPATAAAPQVERGTPPSGPELRPESRQGGVPPWPAEQRPRVHGQRLPSGRMAAAAQHQNAYLYVDWDFGSASGFWNINQTMRISKKASSTYWAQFWSWTDADYGGYIGLQTNGVRFDGSTGETAIFSLWNANAARGDGCGQFEGEGIGYSCRLPFRIRTNATYRLRVLRLHADAEGQWWGGWVRSFRTGTNYHIGDIRVPASHQSMGVPSNFSEYFGDAVACTKVPVSKVHWSQPAANRTGNGPYQYSSSYAGFAGGNCTSGSVTPEDNQRTHGVAVNLGGR